MSPRVLYATRAGVGILGLCTSPLWFPETLTAVGRLIGAL